MIAYMDHRSKLIDEQELGGIGGEDDMIHGLGWASDDEQDEEDVEKTDCDLMAQEDNKEPGPLDVSPAPPSLLPGPIGLGNKAVPEVHAGDNAVA